jgi:hypothetical protein
LPESGKSFKFPASITKTPTCIGWRFFYAPSKNVD